MPPNDDPYVYPGTDVLKNKADLREAEDLKTYERFASADALLILPDDIPLTPDGYRAIHRYLFQDVYDWAGQDRTVDIAKDHSYFCRAQYIAPQLEQRFEKIAAELESWRGLSDAAFAAHVAEHICELDAIHPFREGNGRTLRAWLGLVGARTGHTIDQAQLSATEWHQAAVKGFSGDCDAMSRVIAAAIRR
jgi:cell filamentation protein